MSERDDKGSPKTDASSPTPNESMVRLRKLCGDKREQIEAENLKLKRERNGRRWKAQRDPEKYEQQKVNQREEYRAAIEATGREVRTYNPVQGDTPVERRANRRVRDAERKRKERGNLSQDAKYREADRKWCYRRRKAGDTEEQIRNGLDARIEARRPKLSAYADNSNFGIF